MPTKTDYSTATNNSSQWTQVSREVRGEIMKTDIYCEIQCPQEVASLAQDLINEAFERFRQFADRYSRFERGNALWELNEGTSVCVSPELFSLIEQAISWHTITAGTFDPCVLPNLEHEGYHGVYQGTNSAPFSLSDIVLDHTSLTITKPAGLKIDLGGIGKGFIVDRIAELFEEHFQNFLIDAGGDIRVRGTNRVQGYDFWAIDIENPLHTDKTVSTLLLKDQAVATSGSNRRIWKKDGVTKHHLIDPHTHQSAASDFASVTVLANTTTAADVWAKTVFLAGTSGALALADQYTLPFLALTRNGEMLSNKHIEPYVWH